MESDSLRLGAGLAIAEALGWEALLTVSPIQVYSSDTELFAQGSSPEEVYLVHWGLLKLIRHLQDGREVIAALRYPGQLSGAAAVMLQKSHAVTAVTVGRCHLRRISATAFARLLKTHPQFAWQVLLAHSREIYDHYDHVAELACCSARSRVEHFLWKLLPPDAPNTSKGHIRLQIPLKHWEIAELLAITPAYLSRLLGQLEESGVLQRKGGWIIVLNPASLWHLT